MENSTHQPNDAYDPPDGESYAIQGILDDMNAYERRKAGERLTHLLHLHGLEVEITGIEPTEVQVIADRLGADYEAPKL